LISSSSSGFVGTHLGVSGLLRALVSWNNFQMLLMYLTSSRVQPLEFLIGPVVVVFFLNWRQVWRDPDTFANLRWAVRRWRSWWKWSNAGQGLRW
jgi:hypothetical protein